MGFKAILLQPSPITALTTSRRARLPSAYFLAREKRWHTLNGGTVRTATSELIQASTKQ